MFGLKGKTLLFFIITTVVLAVLGSYFFIRITDLKNKVQAQFEPQQQTRLLKDLTLNINNLNNQYLNDTLVLSSAYIDSIIHNVEESILKIQQENQRLQFVTRHHLDSIPSLLHELKRKNFQLKKLRKAGENDFVFSLEKVIQDEFKNKLLSEKDSIIVTNQITSYIRENKILLDKQAEVSDQNSDRGFFQRLFKSKEKKNPPPEIRLESRTPIFLDTTIKQQVDTISPQRSARAGIDLLTLYDKIQSRRISYINNIQAVEKEIFELNYDVNKKIENIINEFILQQYVSYEDYLSDIKSETGNQVTVLLFTILGFILFSIILMYRFFKDINRNVEYQSSLKLKEAEAVRQSEEKQRFLNTMSHEIRTPLTSIIGYADMLEGDDKKIRAIRSSAHYLLQMTNEILDIAKINMGVFEIREKNIDLRDVLHEIQENLAPAIESKGLKPIFNLPKQAIFVKTDGHRIQQILYNLIHNSIKFTSDGFVQLQVDVTEFTHQYQLVLKVIDSGVGMNQEEQIHVFEDFKQAGTHKSKMQGTGLGLGIVEKLVELLAGQMYVESEVGKGTTFTLKFNFPKAADNQDLEFKKDNSTLNFDNFLQNKSILIIDDDELITSLYERILIPTNAKVTVYNNPKEAFEEALDEPFDLILVDYRMPGMTGYQFLQYLSSRKEKMPKTIISTANAMLDEQEKNELKAFDEVIFKPFNKTSFLNTIATVLEVKIQLPQNKSVGNPVEGTIDLQNLIHYVGDNPKDLIAVLELIVSETDKSLKVLKFAIEQRNREEIAFVIHQLTSRFSQVDPALTAPTQDLEATLRTANSVMDVEQLEALYQNWMNAHRLIEQKLVELKQANRSD